MHTVFVLFVVLLLPCAVISSKDKEKNQYLVNWKITDECFTVPWSGGVGYHCAPYDYSVNPEGFAYNGDMVSFFGNHKMVPLAYAGRQFATEPHISSWKTCAANCSTMLGTYQAANAIPNWKISGKSKCVAWQFEHNTQLCTYFDSFCDGTNAQWPDKMMCGFSNTRDKGEVSGTLHSADILAIKAYSYTTTYDDTPGDPHLDHWPMLSYMPDPITTVSTTTLSTVSTTAVVTTTVVPSSSAGDSTATTTTTSTTTTTTPATYCPAGFYYRQYASVTVELLTNFSLKIMRLNDAPLFRTGDTLIDAPFVRTGDTLRFSTHRLAGQILMPYFTTVTVETINNNIVTVDTSALKNFSELQPRFASDNKTLSIPSFGGSCTCGNTVFFAADTLACGKLQCHNGTPGICNSTELNWSATHLGVPTIVNCSNTNNTNVQLSATVTHDIPLNGTIYCNTHQIKLDVNTEIIAIGAIIYKPQSSSSYEEILGNVDTIVNSTHVTFVPKDNVCNVPLNAMELIFSSFCSACLANEWSASSGALACVPHELCQTPPFTTLINGTSKTPTVCVRPDTNATCPPYFYSSVNVTNVSALTTIQTSNDLSVFTGVLTTSGAVLPTNNVNERSNALLTNNLTQIRHSLFVNDVVPTINAIISAPTLTLETCFYETKGRVDLLQRYCIEATPPCGADGAAKYEQLPLTSTSDRVCRDCVLANKSDLAGNDCPSLSRTPIDSECTWPIAYVRGQREEHFEASTRENITIQITHSTHLWTENTQCCRLVQAGNLTFDDFNSYVQPYTDTFLSHYNWSSLQNISNAVQDTTALSHCDNLIQTQKWHNVTTTITSTTVTTISTTTTIYMPPSTLIPKGKTDDRVYIMALFLTALILAICLWAVVLYCKVKWIGIPHYTAVSGNKVKFQSPSQSPLSTFANLIATFATDVASKFR